MEMEIQLVQSLEASFEESLPHGIKYLNTHRPLSPGPLLGVRTWGRISSNGSAPVCAWKTATE